MGSEAGGPGAGAPGPLHVAAPVARAWAVAAAAAAVRVPAGNAEADAWIARGWADVAVGCVALDGPGFTAPARRLARQDGPGAFSGLDEAVQAVRITSGGQHAARLRYLRRFAGPVPPWYPDSRPVAGPIRGLGERAWRAANLLAEFGGLLMATAARLPQAPACPLVSARQLAWGARYRPSPSEDHVTLHLPVNRRLARRTWMCLPGLPGPGTAIAEVPSAATPMAQQIWRGIHEGAHLDHLSALARLGRPLAPNPGEFGAGLLVAESYAMAVEILAAVECVLAGEGHAVWQLGAGLIERATRLPGGSNPAAEFADLPTLAEIYVLGPLEVLAGAQDCAPAGPPSATPAATPSAALPSATPAATPSAALPSEIARSLRDRWRSACAAYPPAAAFGSAAVELVGRPAAPPGRPAESPGWPAEPPGA